MLIFDEIRLKYFIFNLEEYVRQMCILYFIKYKNYSRSSFIVEKKINLKETRKRIDILLMHHTSPKILIECKSPNIVINNKIFEQIARYNKFINAKKILITNGINHFYFNYDIFYKKYSLI